MNPPWLTDIFNRTSSTDDVDASVTDRSRRLRIRREHERRRSSRAKREAVVHEWHKSKPKDLLEYVVVHEMLHLITPAHSEQFVALVSKHYPAWREARAELNELPLGAEGWRL